jgi:hypothetical protein
MNCGGVWPPAETLPRKQGNPRHLPWKTLLPKRDRLAAPVAEKRRLAAEFASIQQNRESVQEPNLVLSALLNQYKSSRTHNPNSQTQVGPSSPQALRRSCSPTHVHTARHGTTGPTPELYGVEGDRRANAGIQSFAGDGRSWREVLRGQMRCRCKCNNQGAAKSSKPANTNVACCIGTED